ncbi:relaxase/mobilization nuclease domain-containing protein [Pseudomonas sp. G5(2012)]|uniref:relaxase/mobilization nuclease domain-containing protein n=1 Tax=unclassified Pseudomonas TaxID=196821 RepID=UPI0003432606|nr:relaxase/mobilization nuclease domain-containing protein [Pseudomonas sp. G5(2012)]EPA94937.1 hypothetical protein PG5_45830 [Pseudomonas sp. G5(2012)]
MINGLAMQTTGAQKAVDYLTGDEYYDKESLEWKQRDPAPVVLEGDPKSFVQACDSLTFKNKYTSGVLSFSPEETVLINANPGLKDKILQDFKSFAFAGIPEDCRNMLAVEHTHTGRLEIHYTIPRVHLGSGKYWNPFEPNYVGKRGKGSDYKFREQNDVYVDYACNKFGLQNPRDLSVARDIKINPFDKNAQSKREIHKAVADLVNSGHITCREDIEKFFVQAGGEITRHSDEYISVKFGDQKSMRFRGGIYDKSEFSGAAISERELQEAKRPTAESIGREFKRVMEERTDRVEKRHGEAEKYVDSDKTADNEFESDISADADAINEIDKAAEDIPDLKSSVGDFISSNSDAIEDYKQATIGSGVEASDVAIAQTDDPVVRFFQQQFKAQAQRLEQQAITAAKQRWANHKLPAGHDNLLADSVGSIFKAMLGTRTGVDIDRPGRAYTRTQLHQDAAKVSESTQERAVLLEVERKKMIQDALTSAQQRHQIEQDDQAARQKQDAGYVPTWKRNGHDLDDQNNGPRPGGR